MNSTPPRGESFVCHWNNNSHLTCWWCFCVLSYTFISRECVKNSWCCIRTGFGRSQLYFTNAQNTQNQCHVCINHFPCVGSCDLRIINYCRWWVYRTEPTKMKHSHACYMWKWIFQLHSKNNQKFIFPAEHDIEKWRKFSNFHHVIA